MGIVFGLLLLIRLRPTSLGEWRGMVIEAKKNYFILLSRGRRYYVYSKDHDYYFGDFIKINGSLEVFETTKYEGYFDFEKYLENKGVNYQLNAYQISSIFQLVPLRILEKRFLDNFSPQTASLIDALLFSFRDSKDDVISASLTLGIYSQLSNGGLILSSYLSLFEPIVYRLKKEEHGHILKLVLIFPFLILSPIKIGIWKLILLNLSRLIFPSKEIRHEHRLLLSALLIVFLDRYAILSSGFFFAYGLSTLLLLSSRMLNKGRNFLVKKLRRRVLLEAFIFPSSFGSGRIGILSPFLRVITTPIIMPFIALSLISFLSFPFTHILEWYGSFIYKSLSILRISEISTPWIGYNGETVRLLLYVVLVISLFFFDLGLDHLAFQTLKLTGLAILINILPISNLLTKEVTFINVGQGDSILIRDGLKTIMIDTGGTRSFDIAKEVDIPYLYKKRIFHLDYLIITHDDFDHSGGADYLRKNYDVNHFVTSPNSFPLTIGDITLTNLNTYGGEGNEGSLVLYTEFIGRRFLFMGDAGVDIEKKIIRDNPDLRCDILKVGHHGSNTSTSESFIRTIRPKEAVISVGKKNIYNHPNDDVIETLRRYKVVIRRTDEEGSISYWGKRF